jgi:adenylate cyclase, class 2
MRDQELEIKFYVQNLPAVEARLQNLGAHLEAPRVFEANLRFDTPTGALSRNAQVVRLRQDANVRITYKGPASDSGGARLRTEIEFQVSDFDAARAFLEALGYQVMMVYEKYRTTYAFDETEVVLDELPYGNFVEIEGPDSDTIHAVAEKLGLDWNAGINASYVVLFEQLRRRLELNFRDLTFNSFSGLAFTASDLRVTPADTPAQ